MNDLQQWFDFPLGFGGASISGEGGGYGFGQIDEAAAIDLLEYAFSQGFRVFDTAPIYGFGTSEVRIGKAFQRKREEVFLVSKSGVSWHPNQRVDMTNRPEVAKKMLTESLARLNTEYIDLYMVHWPDESVDIRQTLEPLAQAQSEGKIKHLGLCNTHREDLAKAREVAEIVVVQSECNLFNRKLLELKPELEQTGTKIMSWGTLDKGILTGRVKSTERKYDKSDARSWAPWWKKGDNEKKIQKMEELAPWMEECGVSGLELALGHNLNNCGLDMALVGARSHEQVDTVVAALNNLPSSEFLAEAVRRVEC